MKILTGKVVGGRIDLPEDLLEEGTLVTMLIRDEEEGFELSPELEDELVDAMAEADRGETVEGWQLLQGLKG